MNEEKNNETTVIPGFHYDAFISYRHCDLDMFVAENLHKQLETFRLPKDVAKRLAGKKTKIERVFRDQEELPLTSNLEDPITQALQNSDWLIVICSPRLKDSLWCKKEIETFIQMHGRDRVLAVLIEGEPCDSFPEELIYKTENVVLPSGMVEEVRIKAEPLAADFRGEDKKAVLKKMKTEMLRLLAPMFGVNYDDLRQRHRERRQRRILSVSIFAAVVCLAFAVFCGIIALRLHDKNVQIQALSENILEQNEISKYNQALSLAQISSQYMKEGNRNEAVQNALWALTDYESLSMPYTPEAHYALANALRIYDMGTVYRVDKQYVLQAVAREVKCHPDLTKVVVWDESDTITIFNLETGEVNTIGANECGVAGGDEFVFVGSDRLAYKGTDYKVHIYDLNKNEDVAVIETMSAYGIYADVNGKYLAVDKGTFFEIYDGAGLEQIGTTPKMNGFNANDTQYITNDDILIASVLERNEGDKAETRLVFIDLTTMSVMSEYDVGTMRLKDVQYRDGVVYLALDEYADNIMYYDSESANLVAYDVRNGSLLWQHKYAGGVSERIVLSGNPDCQELLFVMYNTIANHNIHTGECEFSRGLSSPVKDVVSFAGNNAFMCISKNGNVIMASKDYNGVVDVSHTFEGVSTANAYMEITSRTIVAVEEREHTVTFYTKEGDPQMQVVEEKVGYPETKYYYIGNEMQEMLEGYDAEYPQTAISALFSNDQKYFLVNYINSTVIYDAETKEMLKVIDGGVNAIWCSNEDANGNRYVWGYSGGVAINQELNPIMFVEDMCDVDTDASKIYFTSTLGDYVAPIYTIEDLLQKANEYLEN